MEFLKISQHYLSTIREYATQKKTRKLYGRTCVTSVKSGDQVKDKHVITFFFNVNDTIKYLSGLVFNLKRSN